jgi:CheY-like chemotaxis protein
MSSHILDCIADIPRVLVADDDEDTRALVSATLGDEGYDVVTASTGREASRILENLSMIAWSLDVIDLVLADVRMPEMTGEELVALLRKARWPVPVVLMTAYADDAMREHARAFDVVLLEKPLSPRRLKETVRSEMLRIGPHT